LEEKVALKRSRPASALDATMILLEPTEDFCAGK